MESTSSQVPGRRREYGLKCRVYRSGATQSGTPLDKSIRTALECDGRG
jgi:hypothetical protein